MCYSKIMRKPLIRAKQILIVDDEPTLVFFLRQGLEAAEVEFSIDNASSGEEALAKLAHNRYDLLVTDLKMPGISGLTLIDAARSLQPHLAIIVMTAFDSPEVHDKAIKLGVDGYLKKPFSTATLRDLATKILLTGDKYLVDPSLQDVVAE